MTLPKQVSKDPRDWRTSSRSDNGGNCVEVALDLTEVGVRDTKDREGGRLDVSGPAWDALVRAVKR